MMLVVAAVACPLVGVTEDDKRVAHRVNMDGLPMETWETATHATAVCGAAVKLVELPWKQLRTRGTKVTRCQPCREWRYLDEVAP